LRRQKEYKRKRLPKEERWLGGEFLIARLRKTVWLEGAAGAKRTA
jgi:hypothetical protein